MSIEGAEHLRSIITRWDAEYEEKALALDHLARYMFALDLLVADVKAYRSRLEQELATRAETKRMEFDGITAEVKAGTKHKEWDSPLLLSRVVARAKDEREVNEETGEYEPESEAVARVLNECARMEWRLTPLRARGLDPDDFSTVEWGLPRVVIRAKEGD